MNNFYDERLDSKVSEALRNYRVPFQSDDWEVFEKRLNREPFLVPHLWIAKGIEFGLLLLMIFTFYSVLDSNNPASNISSVPFNTEIKNTPSPADEAADKRLSPSDESTSLEAKSINDVLLPLEKSGVANTVAEVAKTAVIGTTKNAGNGTATNGSATNNGVYTPSNGSFNAGIGKNSNRNNTPSTVTGNTGNNEKNLSPTTSQMNDPIAAMDFRNGNFFNEMIHKVAEINSLVNQLVLPTLKKVTYAYYTPPPKVAPRKRDKTQHYLGAAFGTDFNFTDHTFSPGFSILTSYTYTLNNKISIQTGINYNLKRQLNENKSTLDSVTYNTRRTLTGYSFGIPIVVRMNVWNKKERTLYFNAGVINSLRASSSAVAVIDQSYIDGEGILQESQYRSSSLNDNEKGAFQAGSLKDNFSMSLMGSLGYEHKTGYNTRIFLEAGYQHTIVGTKANRFITPSLNVGFRARIK